MALNTACYAYQPVPHPLVAANQRVRVHLTPDGTTELARYLGPQVGVAEGVVASVAADGAVALGVQWVRTTNGIRQAWAGEGTVTVPAAYIGRVEENTLDRRRSAFAAVAIGAAVIGVAVAALGIGGADGGPGSGGGGPNP